MFPTTRLDLSIHLQTLERFQRRGLRVRLDWDQGIYVGLWNDQSSGEKFSKDPRRDKATPRSSCNGECEDRNWTHLGLPRASQGLEDAKKKAGIYDVVASGRHEADGRPP